MVHSEIPLSCGMEEYIAPTSKDTRIESSGKTISCKLCNKCGVSQTQNGNVSTCSLRK